MQRRKVHIVARPASFDYVEKKLSLSKTSGHNVISLLWKKNVSQGDAYRKEAEEARRMAGLALKQDSKASWQRLADEWNKLAQEVDMNSTPPFKTEKNSS